MEPNCGRPVHHGFSLNDKAEAVGGVRDGDPPGEPEIAAALGVAFVVTTSNRLRRFNWLIVPAQAIAPHAASTSRGGFFRK